MANYLLTQTGEEVQDILNQAPETEAGLQQEVTNREQAIADEEQAREQAVAAEATARADADETLDAKIDAETTRAEGAEGALTDAIAQEATDRTTAVAAEATARQQADTAQQQALAQETSRAQQAELANAQAISTNAQALQAEASSRQNADTELQDHINDEETRAKAAEATLQSNIDAIGQTGGAAVAAERARAEAAESSLDDKIDAETTRAEGAEQTLTGAIAQEVTDRTTAVAAEATARADADAALQTAINGKQNTIADLANIRSGAAAGATAYQKPATGIPATDMSAEVQASLGKADTALQEHQSLADYATKQEVTTALSDKANAADVYTKTETYSKTEVNELITTPNQQYVSVTATAQTTAVTDLLPATGEADTIYRVGNWDGTQYDPTMYALYAWNGSAYVCLAVRSFVGEVYDISVNHPDGQGNPTPYADLAAALGASGANIPADIRRGGMSIKFIQGTAQSSDNKYVQYRYMESDATTASTFTNVANWQGEYPFYYTNSGSFNEIVKEIYIPTSIVDWSDVTFIRVFKAYLLDSKYLAGFSLYAGGYKPCYLSFDTEQEALDYCKSNIKYGNAYAVFDWDKIPSGRTDFTLALKKYAADLNYNPVIKEYVLSLNNVTDSDLTVGVVSNNIANPDNIEVGRYVKNNGSFADNASWAMIKVPVTAGKEYTVAGFTVGRSTMPIAYYNDDTLVQAGLTIANPQGTTNPTTLTVPSGANLLYIDIASDDLVPADYSQIQINVGDELLSYDEYKVAITKINNIPLVGEGGSTEGMSTIVIDLPISDGTNIQSGYAYIDSTDRSVKVKA